jgi:hypothetical protein
MAVALCRAMNLAPVRVEHAHGDGAGRPVYVREERDCPSRVPGVGDRRCASVWGNSAGIGDAAPAFQASISLCSRRPAAGLPELRRPPLQSGMAG